MKKKIFNILIIFLLCALTAKAQRQTAPFAITVCYGYLNNDIILREYEVHHGLTYLAGPVYCKFEYRSGNQKFGYGLSVLYFKADWETLGVVRVYEDSMWKYLYTALANEVEGYSFVFKFNWYAVRTKKFDAFVSIGSGFQFIQWKLDPNYPPCYSMEDCEYGFPEALRYHVPLVAEATMGMRYRIIPHLALYCETGYSKASLQFGLSGQF
jgi:hypothetical protein